MRTFGALLVLCYIALAVDGKKTRLSDLAQLARPGEFPYFAAFFAGETFFCGGALISKTHVLTAAHCLKDLFEDPYAFERLRIEVGGTTVGAGKSHKVRRISYHRGYVNSLYDPRLLPNDVGVVTLKTPVTLSATVKIIDLPSPGFEVPTNAKVATCGYGNARPDGPTSTQLKKDHFSVMSRRECNDYYQSSYLHKSISNSQICAKSSPGYGTCQGDSGSPLVYQNKVVGVVSGGDGGCAEGNPDVYTKISSFIPFIKYEMNYDFGTTEGANSPGKSLNADDVTASPVLPPQNDPFDGWSGAWETFPPQAFDPSLNPSWGTGSDLSPSFPQYEPESGFVQGSESWYPFEGSNGFYPGFENIH